MNIQVPLQLKKQFLKSYLLVMVCLLVYTGGAAQCNPGDIGGQVFRDVPAADANNSNAYGSVDANEQGLSGVTVTIVDPNGNTQNVTTDAAGNWSANPTSFPVRVEYAWTDAWLDISPGNINNTDVQIITASNCGLEFGLYYADEYCQMVPDVFTSCFVVGDPMGGGTTGAADAIVSFPYNSLGDVTAPSHDAFMSEVGAVWGATYHRRSQHAFFGAVMKRHVGLGPAGIGGIYRIDYSGAAPTASSFISLSVLGVNLGTEPTRTLSADWATPSADPLMFDAAGKIGLGDLELSDDGNTMFAVNLFTKKIVTIDLTGYYTTGSLPGTAQIDSLPAMPNLSCTNGEARPFALKYRRGKLYVGVVCSAENGGTTSDLSATVLAYDMANGTWSNAVNSFSLDYTKGGAFDNVCTTWQPWIGTYDDAAFACRATPMLVDIEFAGDDAIVLGFADRYTFQKFTLQQDVSNTNQESVINGGDILRGYFNGTNYSMESNGTIPDGGGCGANGEGIGGGEFFCGDFIGTEHSEISQGAMAMLAGSGEILLSVINPVNYNSGGTRRFDLTTGGSSTATGYELYETAGSTIPGGGNGFAIKGGGMGDLELLCDPAPIEILSYLWEDTNADGIQDPTESGIAGIEVSLFDINGNLLWLDTTDVNGLYSFSDTLEPSTLYYVTIGTDSEFNLLDNTLNDSLLLTLPNVGMGANADKNDSDIRIATGVNANIDGYPYYTLTTGTSGQLFHQLDAGFFPPCTDPDLVGTDTTICEGDIIDLKLLVDDLNATPGICYYFASLDDALNEVAFLSGIETPTALTTYYIRKNTNDVTCFDIDSLVVDISPLPVLVTSDITLCAGETTSLDAWTIEITGLPGMTSYYPTLADANAETNALASSIVTPADTTTYYVRVNWTNAPFCSDVDSIVLSVDPCAFDLALKMELSPGQNGLVNSGDTILHTVWLYNQGGVDAYDIELTTFLSPGIIFDNTINTNAAWSQSGSTLMNTISGPFLPGDSISIDLALVVDPYYSGASISNFIEITGYDDDTNPGNTPPTDEDSVTDTNGYNDFVIDNEINDNPDNPGDDDDHDIEILFIIPDFDLAMTSQTTSALVFPCDTVTYATWIYNQGNQSAYDVDLTDYIPAGMTFDGTLPNNGSWGLVSGLPTYNLAGPVGPGDSVLVFLDLVIDCNNTNASIDNFIEITSFDDDAISGNSVLPDADSMTDLDPNNDQNIDNEINDNPDNPNDDDDHDGSTLTVYQGIPAVIDTLHFTTPYNTGLINLCLDLSQLSDVVITASSCGNPINGNLTITSPSECVNYMPNTNYTGQDTACVVLCDANAICDTTILVFTVEAPPLLSIDTLYYTTDYNTDLTNLCLDLSELTGPLNTVGSCGAASDGVLFITSPSECVDYSPNTNYSGQDTACVVICDVNAVCDTTILVFTVNPEIILTIDTLYYTTDYNTDLTNLCLDLSELTGAVNTVASCEAPVNGILSINSPDECVDYAPGNNYIGQDTACVVICDVNAICDSTVLIFTVNPPPSLNIDTVHFTTPINTGLTNLCLDLSDLTGAINTVAICGNPTNGTLTINTPNECVDYTPNNNYTGQDTACVVICDMNAVCDTTILVFTVNPVLISDTDTLYFTTGYNGPLTNLCVDISELSGPVSTVANCGGPTNGMVIVTTPSECVDYIPDNGFVGQDTACVVVCDVNALCDTTVLIFTVNPPPVMDTIYLSLAVDDVLPNICMDLSEFTVGIGSVASCGDPTNGTLNISSPNQCVGYIPNNGYVGQDTACVVVCDLNAVCDTTILVFTITPDCSDILSEVNLTAMLNDCADTAKFCLSIPMVEIFNYNILDNGAPYMGNIQACNFDTSFLFSYAVLPGQGAAGPYTVSSWLVNGTSYSGTVDDMQALTDSMNVWNPSGNWVLNATSFSIVGGSTADEFSAITIGAIQLMSMMSLTPNGTEIELLSGQHEIIFSDVSLGCIDTLQVAVNCPNCPNLFTGTENIIANDCNTLESYCTPILSTDIANYLITDNGASYTGGIGMCNLNAAISIDTGYHVVIFNDVVNSCVDTAFLNVSCSNCPDLIADETITLDDCNDLSDYCVNIHPDNFAAYQVSDNGNVFTGALAGCNFDSLVTYITIGFNLGGNYTLTEWIVGSTNYGGITFSTTEQLVDSMNVWDPSGNWTLTGLFITGEGQLNNFGPLVIDANGTEYAPSPTLQLSPNGIAMQLNTGLHVITTIEILTGCTDTAMVQVNCVPPNGGCDFIGAGFQALNLGNCNEAAPLCLDVPLAGVSNFEILDNGTLFTGTTGQCGIDSVPIYSYLLLTGGGSFGPYNLDNWTVNGQIFSGMFNTINDLVDLMNIWNPAGNWVHDIPNELIRGTDVGQTYSAMTITHNATNAQSTLPVVFEEMYTQLSVNLTAGTHEVIVNDLVNNCSDTATIMVACISPEIWVDTLELLYTDTICFDLSELPGTANSIVNFCEDSSGDYVIFEPISSSYCLSMTGVEVGLDSACIAVCDDLGFCDTTWVYIYVEDGIRIPDANQDSFYTTINTPITVDVTMNDDFGGGPGTITVIEYPEFGGIVVDSFGTIVYAPEVDYCSQTPDQLRYLLCNDFGCDTTEVFFFVPCTDLIFVSGFSPNGDGINDFFHIDGLDNFPDHKLSIFNRWGNRIYYAEAYRNNWGGTFNEDMADLPDGTYFYVFDPGDGSDLRSGYIQVHR